MPRVYSFYSSFNRWLQFFLNVAIIFCFGFFAAGDIKPLNIQTVLAPQSILLKLYKVCVFWHWLYRNIIFLKSSLVRIWIILGLFTGLNKLHTENLSYKKEKKPLDLWFFIRIVKTMKKIRWILNTIENTSVLVIISYCLHIWWRQHWFIYS